MPRAEVARGGTVPSLRRTGTTGTYTGWGLRFAQPGDTFLGRGLTIAQMPRQGPGRNARQGFFPRGVWEEFEKGWKLGIFFHTPCSGRQDGTPQNIGCQLDDGRGETAEDAPGTCPGRVHRRFALDGCGAQTDMQLWDDVIRATPKQSGRSSIMVENCHWGSKARAGACWACHAGSDAGHVRPTAPLHVYKNWSGGAGPRGGMGKMRHRGRRHTVGNENIGEPAWKNSEWCAEMFLPWQDIRRRARELLVRRRQPGER
eukprot:gene24849-biopygen19456